MIVLFPICLVTSSVGVGAAIAARNGPAVCGWVAATCAWLALLARCWADRG